MLNGIRVFSADTVWRQILGDLNASVVDNADIADVNLDTLDIVQPITMMELKTAVLRAMDNTAVLRKIFGRDVVLPPLQMQIVIWLHRSGGMSVAELKNVLGYSPDAATHTVDTAIYNLRRVFGHEFIHNQNGIYKLGKL